jgi:cardiolipin synthase (CMP-forming)
VSLRWIPNAITIARLVAAFPLLWLLMNRHFTAALVLAVLAGISDALMVSACFVGLWWSFQIPGWFLLLVLGRDLVIVSGALAWWRVIGVFKPAPSPLSKTNTAVQILLVAVLLVNAAVQPLPLSVLQGLVLASAIMTVASGLDYLWRYGSRAVRALRSKQ